MINKKFGLILTAGILLLVACEEEQSTAQGNTEEKTSIEEASTEEETTTETTEEDLEEESSPEANSDTASDLLSNGEMTSFMFNEAGEFSIFCELHPVMQMTVLVEEDAEQLAEMAVDIAD